MSVKVSINIPVRDLGKSTAFFVGLGFDRSAQFAGDPSVSCIVISDDIYLMLLSEARFKEISRKGLVDATKSAETIVQLRLESRQRVDEVVDRAFAVGARLHHEPNDQGFLYGRSFQDLDGHLWDVFYMDPASTPM